MTELTVTAAPALASPPSSVRVHVSTSGVVVALTCLLLSGSAFLGARLEVGDFLVHPCLITFPILGVTALTRLNLLGPRRIVGAAWLFMLFVATAAAVDPQPGQLGEIGKPVVMFALMFFVALSIRSERDMNIAALMLAVASLVFAAKAIIAGPNMRDAGVNPFKGIGDKNSYSLFSLPIFLLSGWLLQDRRGRLSWFERGVHIASMLATLVATFESSNRSGWLGLVLIGVMLLGSGRRLRTLALIGVLAGGTYVVVDRYLGASIFNHRVEQTEQGYSSDALREDLLSTSIRIGVDHPVFGVGPLTLPYELADRLNFAEADNIDPHNVLAYVVGGCGFPAAIAMFLWLGTMIYRPRRLPAPARAAHGLLAMMAILWFVRGMFSREILYIPAFWLAMGLALALCRLRGVWKTR